MVKAVGVLRHQFFGSYSCIIALGFDDESSAKDALETLKDNWKVGEKNKSVLLWFGDNDSLDKMEENLKKYNLTITPCGWSHCKKQCKDASISSIAHSIDVGPCFTVEIPTVSRDQVSMF